MTKLFNLTTTIVQAASEFVPAGYVVEFESKVSRLTIKRGEFHSWITLNIHNSIDLKEIVTEQVKFVDTLYIHAKTEHEKTGLKLLSYEMAAESEPK